MILNEENLSRLKQLAKFKEIIRPMLGSVNVHLWCVRNGVEVALEIPEISPMETFCLAYQTVEDKSVYDPQLSVGVKDFLRKLGDRVVVSDNEDFAYLFPRDLYEKILLFGVLPS